MTIKSWVGGVQDQTLIESAWERQMNMAGLEAYERSRLKSNGEQKEASESSAGQKIIRKLLVDASKGIEKMQKDVLNINRVGRSLKASVIMVPPETCAIITLRAMIDKTYSVTELDDGFNFQVLCKNVSKGIEAELNFRNWLQSSEKLAKEYAKAQGYNSVPKSIAQRLIEDKGTSARSLRNWKNTFAEMNEYEWNNLEKHYCGEAMVQTTVETLPNSFESIVFTKRGKKTKKVRMTQELRQRIDDTESHIAQIQVVRKPMLAKPERWVKA